MVKDHTFALFEFWDPSLIVSMMYVDALLSGAVYPMVINNDRNYLGGNQYCIVLLKCKNNNYFHFNY